MLFRKRVGANKNSIFVCILICLILIPNVSNEDTCIDFAFVTL